MATVKKTIGRLPVYKGDWVAGIYSMLNQVSYLGSTFQSKIDNNTSQPATVVNNALQVNANWSVVSNGTAAYLADSRLTSVEGKTVQLEQEVNQSIIITPSADIVFSKNKISISGTCNIYLVASNGEQVAQIDISNTDYTLWNNEVLLWDLNNNSTVIKRNNDARPSRYVLLSYCSTHGTINSGELFEKSLANPKINVTFDSLNYVTDRDVLRYKLSDNDMSRGGLANSEDYNEHRYVRSDVILIEENSVISLTNPSDNYLIGINCGSVDSQGNITHIKDSGWISRCNEKSIRITGNYIRVVVSKRTNGVVEYTPDNAISESGIILLMNRMVDSRMSSNQYLSNRIRRVMPCVDSEMSDVLTTAIFERGSLHYSEDMDNANRIRLKDSIIVKNNSEIKYTLKQGYRIGIHSGVISLNGNTTHTDDSGWILGDGSEKVARIKGNCYRIVISKIVNGNEVQIDLTDKGILSLISDIPTDYGRCIGEEDIAELTGTPIPMEYPYQVISDNGAMQGMTVINNELWHFTASNDDNSNFAKIKRFSLVDYSELQYYSHNLGHAASVDYNQLTDYMAIFNGTWRTDVLPRLDLIKGSSISENIDIKGDNVLSINFFTEKKSIGGSGLAGCFGDKGTVYLLTGQGGLPRTIYKAKLGMGNNDYSDKSSNGDDVNRWGVYTPNCTDSEFNGTCLITGKYVGKETDVYQGCAYHNGEIYLCCGNGTNPVKVWRISLLDNGTYQLNNCIGINEDIPYEPEGVAISGNYIYMGLFNHIVQKTKIIRIPFKGRQSGIASANTKVHFPFKLNHIPCVYVSNISGNGMAYAVNISNASFDIIGDAGALCAWECNI